MKDLTANQKETIIERSIRVAEKNLSTGNWELETARLYISGAYEQPERYKTLLRRGKK